MIPSSLGKTICVLHTQTSQQSHGQKALDNFCLSTTNMERLSLCSVMHQYNIKTRGTCSDTQSIARLFCVFFYIFMGHRTSIRVYMCGTNLGIAQICLCKPSTKGGAIPPVWVVLPSLQKHHAIWDIAVIVSQHRAIWGHQVNTISTCLVLSTTFLPLTSSLCFALTTFLRECMTTD